VSDHNDKDDKHDEPETDALEQETESEETAAAAESADETAEGDDAVSDETSADETSSDEGADDVEASSTEADAPEEPAKPEPVAAVAKTAHGHDDHGHDDHGHGDDHGHDDHGHGLSHVASTKVLLGTFGALMVLTIITVAATMVDLGSSMNLLVAMVVATIKAGLVCMFFMHLRYDKVMHTVAFLSALLFALLFVSFALMDSSEYQQDIVWVEEAAP
jgi:cytochrome c oxidase subunit 4